MTEPVLEAFLLEHLCQRWSPQQIRLRRMYAMQPATGGGVEQITKLVYAHAEWLRDSGDADWEDFHDHAPVYAPQAADRTCPCERGELNGVIA